MTTETVTPGDGAAVVRMAAGYAEAGFHRATLDDEKDRRKFIIAVERLVRSSPEYARYRNYLLEHADAGRCSVLTNLSREESAQGGLELHHYPLSLFEVVQLVLGELEASGARITSFAVAHRVVAHHWRGDVGLVPLTVTAHEAAHSGQLAVHPGTIFGDWRRLLSSCPRGITGEMVASLRSMVARWNEGAPSLERFAIDPVGWSDDVATIERLQQFNEATTRTDDGDIS